MIVDKLNVNKLETVSCWFGKVKWSSYKIRKCSYKIRL